MRDELRASQWTLGGGRPNRELMALTEEETMSDTKMRLSIKASREEGERIMRAAATEAAVERETSRRASQGGGGGTDDDSTWVEFDGAALEPLLAVDPGLGEAPVRLLDAQFLIKLADRGGWLQPRHALPDDGFIELQALRAMPGAHTGLRVLCVSHLWLQPDHPDPRRSTLVQLAKALRILTETCGGTLGVFYDFCSVYHGEGLPYQEALFRKALSLQSDLFVHPHTWVLKVPTLPRGYPRGFVFRAGSKPNVAPYMERGWAFCESRIASLIKAHTSQVLTLGRLPHAIDAYASKKKVGMLDDDEKFTSWGLCDLETLIEHCKCPRPPPLTPYQFNVQLEDKCFTSRGRDAPVVRALYRRACLSMQSAVSLDFSELDWGDNEAAQLAKMIGNGWARDCRRLFLGQNKIGTDGLAAIADGLRQAKTLWLESIDLRGNPGGQDARQMVRDAITELQSRGLMKDDRGEDRKVRIFGEPERSARLIQKRVRALFSAAAKTALISVKMSKPVGRNDDGLSPPSKSEQPRKFSPRRSRW